MSSRNSVLKLQSERALAGEVCWVIGLTLSVMAFSIMTHSLTSGDIRCSFTISQSALLCRTSTNVFPYHGDIFTFLH